VERDEKDDGQAEPLLAAIIFTYNPERHELTGLLRSAVSQVGIVLIVDNGSSEDVSGIVSESGLPKCRCYRLGSNRGIAEAINYGIDKACDLGTTHVVLFDQDSLPAPDMVECLFYNHENMVEQGVKVAAVGPRYSDPRSDNPPPFVRLEGLRLMRADCMGLLRVPVDYLVSSGCLIDLRSIEEIGRMRTHLFIDYVDVEWGLRAGSKGYQCFGICDAYMQHKLGEKPLTVLGRKVPMHSPLRHYYHFRNAVWLYRQSWVPLAWKIVDGYRLVFKYIAYSLFTDQRFAHWRMMTRGVWHGLIGKMGAHTA
jgi:rhamnosyltransferase